MNTKTQAQIHLEKDRLQKWVKKLLQDDADKFDFEANFDSSLTYDENKSQMREKLKHFIKTDMKDLKEQVEELKAKDERFQYERNKLIEEQIFKYNQREIPVNTNIDNFYEDINRAASKICQGFSNLCFVKGRGGIGKSYNIRKVLLNTKADFIEVCGDVSEAYLYRLFFENNGKIIWFKDVARLLQGLKSINLIKAATETDDLRLLTKSNYSRAQADLPPRFIWNGRIIFDYNSLQGLSLQEDFEALTTRGDFIEFSLSMDDITYIMRQIAKKPEEIEATEFVIENYRFTGYDLLNLRTQYRAIKTREWAINNNLDWRKEVKAELVNNQSLVRKRLYSLIGNKAVRTSDLKKLVIRSGVVSSLRAADRKVAEWLVLEDLFKVSEEDRNFFVSLKPILLQKTEAI
jgi:hypothetical protein